MRSLGPGAPGLGSLPAAAVAGTEAAAAAPSAAMRHSFTSQVWVWARLHAWTVADDTAASRSGN